MPAGGVVLQSTVRKEMDLDPNADDSKELVTCAGEVATAFAFATNVAGANYIQFAGNVAYARAMLQAALGRQ